MENKINIAELLKDCPKGMELDCTMFNDVTFERFDVEQNRCYFKAGPADTFWTTCYGTINGSPFGKCVIFPKGKTTWEGFVPPCKFKDGDVVVTTLGNIAIIDKRIKKELFYIHALLIGDKFYNDENTEVVVERLATEEEKTKLFQAIEEHGYKWNEETKTLENLVEPKFKVGDKVLWNYDTDVVRTIYKAKYTSNRGYVYWINCDGCSSGWWSENELTPVPDKFDISTLIPFESRVLVRNRKDERWLPVVWGLYDDDDTEYPYNCSGFYYAQCIPYESNEHLLGTTNDCDEYYKTWE